MAIKIPGKLRADDLGELIELVKGKSVLQLGCYCGRALLTVARHARRVWVLDDFRYPDGIEGIVEELKSNVDRYASDESRIDLLYGTADGWTIPPGSEDVQHGEVDVIYRDADRPPGSEDRDQNLALGFFRGRSGVYAWHGQDGRLCWLELEPVPVEVN